MPIKPHAGHGLMQLVPPRRISHIRSNAWRAVWGPTQPSPCIWRGRARSPPSPSPRLRQMHTAGLPKQELERPVRALSEEDAKALLDLATKLSCRISGDNTTLHCTEIDANGAVRHADQVLTKHGITASYGLHSRDLRSIDLNSKSVPYVFVRPNTIIVNLFFLRLLIQSDRILILAPPDNIPSAFASQTQQLFLANLEGRLRSASKQPFELRALEAALITVACTLEAEYLLAREPARAALQVLQERVDVERSQIQDLLHHSRLMSALSNNARLVRDALQEVLNVDEDLAAMYLTDTRAGNPHSVLDHTEAEVLLETYCKVCDQVLEASRALNVAIAKTEDNLKSILDAHRNQIMLLDVRLNIGMLGLSSGTLLAGLYGMNLVNGIEETLWGFPALASCCFGVSTLFMLYGAMRLRKLNSIRIGGRKK